MIRRVTCIIVNETSLPLVHRGNYKLAHGSLDTPIPARIPPGKSGELRVSTSGFMTGTEGWVIFELEGGQAMFEVGWDNPFIGDNMFEQAFRLLPGTTECPAGTYVEAQPQAQNAMTRAPLSEQDAKDADDVVVVYTLKLEPKPVTAPAEVAAAPPREPDPSPDPSAPQVVNITTGEDNHASEVVTTAPPRLCVALNAVDPDDGGGDITDVAAILEVVAKRLEGGLDVVWAKGAKAGLWNPKRWSASEPEEQWARAITEVLLGLPYNGSAAVYGHSNDDGMFYGPFSDPAKSPIAPVAAACQHLVTFGVLSRGFQLAQLGKVGFSCNSAESFEVFKGGKWLKDKEKTLIPKAIEAGLAPGALYVFNPAVAEEQSGIKKPKDDAQRNRQYEGSHIAFALRVDKELKKAQFFDTGGLKVPERGSGHAPHIMADFRSKGSYDEPWWDNVSTPYYIGMGIPGAPFDLGAAVARLKKVRHIGLARFVLTQRGASFSEPPAPGKEHKELLYVSRLLRMYGDAEEQNYSLARYLWSLRRLPGTRQIQAYWFFYVPIDVSAETAAARQKLAKATAMMQGPRQTKVDELGKPIAMQRLLAFGSESDGQAKQFVRTFTKAENNEPNSTKAPRSVQIEEPQYAIPLNLLRFVDRLAPEAMYPSKDKDSKAPGLFLDYAASGSVTA